MSTPRLLGKAAGVIFEDHDDDVFRVNKYFIIRFWLAAWLPLSLSSSAVAQPSVYSGVYAYGEGGLTSSSDWQAITNFVSSAQKDVSIINNFNSWTSGSSTNGTFTFPTAEMNNIRSHGSIPLYTWQPENGDMGVTQSFNCASVAVGAYDSYIQTWATAAKNWGHPFFLRFAHEMNGNWYPWCAGTNGNTSAQYVQMWQHVHDLFTQVGATNVTWVWCVNTVYSGSTPIAGLYPGDNYVDWISLDGYNRLANSWQDFSSVAAATITQLTNLAPGKPIMVGETGCNQTNYPAETKTQWFLNALTNYLPVQQPRIKAWVYFNSTNTTDGNDWRITVPAGAAAGYQQGIAMPYYDTNRYGAISSSPIQPLLNDAMATDTMPPFVSVVSPATDFVTNGAAVNFIASASDKSGIAKVIFSLNGVAQQTNTLAPYQFPWIVPFPAGISYTVVATAYDNAGNTAASIIQVVSQDASIVTLTNSDAPNTSSFNTAGNWDNGQPPTAGFDYVAGAGTILRTPTNSSPNTFAGDSLTLSGTLYFKQTNVITVSNLQLTNGTLVNAFAGGTPNMGRLAGNINVVTNGIIDAGGNAGALTSMQIQAAISGSGGLTIQRPSVVTLTATNTFSGPLTISGSTLQLAGTSSLTPSSLTLQPFVGSLTNNAATNLVQAGGSLNVGYGPAGWLRVGYRTSASLNFVNCVAVLDVSAQSQFTANVGEFSVGNNPVNNDGFTTLGSVILATNNTVTATNVLIGFSSFTGGGTNYLTLGGGSNYFNTPVMTVGGQKENAQLSLPAGGVFRLDNGAARADLTIGGQNWSTGVTCGGLAEFSGGIFTGTLGTLALGQKAGGNVGGASGTLTMGSSAANNVNVNSLLIGSLAGATNNSPAAKGTLTFGGGSFLVNSNVTLASLSGGFGSAVGILNINGGKFAVAGSIVDGGGAATLNVNGGLLDLKPAGDAGAGGITVDSLRLDGVITNALNVTIANLSGGGRMMNQTGVTTVSSSTTPGGTNNIGILTVGSLALAGSTVMELNRTNAPNADRLAANTISFGGALTVTNLGGALQAGDSFQLFSGTIGGAFAATNLPALSPTNLFWDTSTLGSQGILTVATRAAASPIILTPIVNGTNLTLQAGSQTGFNYVLQATAGLVPADWTAIQTNAGGGLVTFTIPISPGARQFFRILVR